VLNKNNIPVFDLQICSDLHVEFHQFDSSTAVTPKAPYLALLGDIGVVADEPVYQNFLLSEAKKFKKVFVIAGNHEYYKNDLEQTESTISKICESHPNLVFLNKTSLLVDGVRILGATLWGKIDPKDKQLFERCISDYRYIMKQNSDNTELIPYTIEDTNTIHDDHVNFLREEIEKAKQNSEPVIVFTHHAPSTRYGCNHPEEPSFLSFSCSELSEFFGPPVKAWCYGHTHWFKDLTIKGTRVVSNPKGYVYEHMMYDSSFVVSVDVVSDKKGDL